MLIKLLKKHSSFFSVPEKAMPSVPKIHLLEDSDVLQTKKFSVKRRAKFISCSRIPLVTPEVDTLEQSVLFFQRKSTNAKSSNLAAKKKNYVPVLSLRTSSRNRGSGRFMQVKDKCV